MDITCPHCGSTFDIIDQRSDAEHKRYMAYVAFGFHHLPEKYRMDFATADDLRAKALVVTGWNIPEIFTSATSLGEAERFAAYHRSPRCFPIIDLKTRAVTLLRPRSQAYSAMGKKDFRESSAAVLKWISELIGMDIETFLDEGLSWAMAA